VIATSLAPGSYRLQLVYSGFARTGSTSTADAQHSECSSISMEVAIAPAGHLLDLATQFDSCSDDVLPPLDLFDQAVHADMPVYVRERVCVCESGQHLIIGRLMMVCEYVAIVGHSTIGTTRLLLVVINRSHTMVEAFDPIFEFLPLYRCTSQHLSLAHDGSGTFERHWVMTFCQVVHWGMSDRGRERVCVSVCECVTTVVLIRIW
jgi:hypothetical protein